jgi:hypothetical protein
MKQKIQSLADYLIDSVHGSGIDRDWKLSQSKNYLNLHNSFHCMDEQGFYCGWQDFTVKLPLNGLVNDFKLIFNGTQYLGIKHGLKEYLYDIISQVIWDYMEACPEAVTLSITCEYQGNLNTLLHKTFAPGEYIRQYFQDMKDFKGKIISFELIY